MIRPGVTAFVYPSAAARDQALWAEAERSAGHGIFPSPALTIEELLTNLVDRLDLPAGQAALGPLAGALLVQEIIRAPEFSHGAYHGLAATWRLPTRLWRLLVEVKAAGLDEQRLREIPGPGVAGLARIMARYQAALDARGLMDQADRLAWLETLLERGERPAAIAEWSRLELRQVIWLRALDLRLLRALALALAVEVEFYFLPPVHSSYASAGKLLRETVKALEHDRKERIAVRFLDLPFDGGPLAGLAQDFMEPTAALTAPEGHLALERAAGRYQEVENLVRRALTAMDQGTAPHDIVLAFPDLGLYGQMAVNVAARLGLPLSHRPGQPLSQTPLFRDLAALLTLPNSGYPRQELARVMESPYLGPCLARLAGVDQPRGAARLLALAGYVELAEGSATGRLTRAAKAHPRLAEEMANISAVYQEITHLLKPSGLHGEPQAPGRFVGRVIGLIHKLGLRAQLLAAGSAPGFEDRTAEDLRAAEAMESQLARFVEATDTARVETELGFGRLVALLGDVFGEVELSGRAAQPFGVRLLRLDQAMGLEPALLLVGGLNQGEFPQRPAGQNLLSSEERMALGAASQEKLPVWRLEDEEYSGQVLRLLWLMASARGAVHLSCCAADAAGREVQPSNLLLSLAHRLDWPLKTSGQGVFGDLTELDDCLDSGSLRVRLASDLLRPGASGSDLAQAVLYHKLAQRTEAGGRWQAIAGRAATLVGQGRLNLLANNERSRQADAFSGRIAARAARQLLYMVMDTEFRAWSPTSLELYAACPLSWFFGHLLKLAVVEEPDWSIKPSGEGRWVHEALSRFFAPDEFDPAWAPDEIRARLGRCLDQAHARLAESGESGHPMLWAVRREIVYTQLLNIIERELADLGTWRPMGVEQEIDPLVTVELTEGGELQLGGRIDRLDATKGGRRVVDYKHTTDYSGMGRAVKDDRMAMDAFQVPVYLAGAAGMAKGGADKVEARLVNTRLPGRPPKTVELEAGAHLIAADPAARQAAREQGQSNLFNAVEDMWSAMIQGGFVAAPERDTCKWCPYSRICRAVGAVSGEEAV